ncbi:MAG: hypothetical protein IT260_10415 [Saprospiraceae bacterium]|nr:hypothetical protein [Saprospiraceae bacterium]
MQTFLKPIPVLGSILLLYLASFFLLDRWPTLPYGGDSWGYYAHLPSFFLYGDTGDYQKTIEATTAHAPNFVDPRIDKYGVRNTPVGRFCIKYPLGVAILEAPFFGIAHRWALNSGGRYPADGFSRPYMLLAGLGVIFYAWLGLVVLWYVLARYFQKSTVPALMVLIALGTNLFYFSTYNNVMSHAFLFFWYAILLRATARFWEEPGWWPAAGVGLALGMIGITRSQEILAALIPVLWGVANWRALAGRWQFVWRHWQYLALALGCFALALIPQLWYWKWVSGQWLYFSYQGEQFDFRHPHIWGGFTSFHNGWLIYTPVMGLALLGLWRLRRVVPEAWWPFWAFFPLHVFITYSWWCWYYINGFGSRPMVEIYPLLALPLGAFWEWGCTKQWKKVLNWALLLFFCWLNIFQTWQIKEGILWTENANRAYYKAIFGTLHPDRNALIAYDSGETQPGADVVPVQTIFQWGYEDSTLAHVVRDPVHTGQFAFQPEEEFSGGRDLAADTLDVHPGDWLRLSVQAYVKGQDKTWNRDALAMLSLEFRDPTGKALKTRGLRISSKIGNPKHSIWDTGDTDRWGEAAILVKVPRSFPRNGKILTYVWNPNRQKLYVDDLKLEVCRKRP